MFKKRLYNKRKKTFKKRVGGSPPTGYKAYKSHPHFDKRHVTGSQKMPSVVGKSDATVSQKMPSNKEHMSGLYSYIADNDLAKSLENMTVVNKKE